tara:strand:- start:11706 stop:12392 length:687 start_codon:yes stop_codon:yes gene_type:complete
MGNKYTCIKKNMKKKCRDFQFILCGTDTDIGKTLISSFFVRGLDSYYWKPIQSGIQDETDSQAVYRLSEVNPNKILKETYIFNEPVSPHWAAEIDCNIINRELLTIPKVNGSLVVETAGGLMVPLTRDFLQIDQIKKWNLPVILVCKSSLGTLNHTLLSVEALQKRNIKISALLINGEKHLDNPKTLKEFTGIPIIAEFPYLENINSNQLDMLWEELKIEENLNLIFK